MLKEENIDEFFEWYLTEYYDKRYATKFNKITASVEYNDLNIATDEVVKIIKSLL